MKKIVLIACLWMVVCSQAQMAKGAKKFLGNITTYGAVRSDFGNYWNQITAENECKWASVEWTRNSMNWGGCDAAYNYAKQNGAMFKFHTLVWGGQYPSWMDNLSSADQLAEVTQWMDLASQRYPDADLIDVVNEAIPGHAPAPFKNALGGDGSTGYDWIITAFKMARARWPHTLLVYNDYNDLTWNTTEYMALMNAIKGSGYVDAMGFQSHGMESWDTATLHTKLEMVHNSVGLPIVISEYDVNIQDDNQQKTVLSQQFPLFWETNYVIGVTLWGYVLGKTWVDYSGLIEDSGKERPAMLWLKSYMANHLNVPSQKDWFGVSAPVFTSPKNVLLDQGVNTVVTLAATANDAITYSLDGGPDASLFNLNGNVLSFKNATSYANPSDANKDNVYNVTVKATANAKSASMDMIVSIRQPKGPYNGNAQSIPGTVEMEKYDFGGEGVSYHDVDSTNSGNFFRQDGVDLDTAGTGNYAIGWTVAGEWTEYTVNVTQSGVNQLTARVASGMDSTAFHWMLDGQTLTASLIVPNTGSWSNYQTISATFPELSTGSHILRFVVDKSYCNIDWIKFDSLNATGIQNPANLGTGAAFINYDVYNIQGTFVGSISNAKEHDLTNSVRKLTQKQGTYVLRPTHGTDVIRMIEIHQ